VNAISRRDLLKGATIGAGALLLDASLVRRALAMVSPVLSVGTITNTSVVLNWTDAGDEQSYEIFKNSALLVKRGSNTITYTAIGLTANTTYTFRVDAKKGGTTAPSNTVQATTTGGGGSNAVISAAMVAARASIPTPSILAGFNVYYDSYGAYP
jgi:hypothetical protein